MIVYILVLIGIWTCLAHIYSHMSALYTFWKHKNSICTCIVPESKAFSPINVVSVLHPMSTYKIRDIVSKFSIGVDLMILNCTGDINIGIMVRNAFVFGISRVWIVGRRVWDKRTAVGGHHYINITYMKELPDDFFSISGISPLFVEQGGASLYDIDWRPALRTRTCIVVGNEHSGIPSHILNKFPNNIVSIPQVGWTRSLNVSVACGIVLSEMQRASMKGVIV